MKTDLAISKSQFGILFLKEIANSHPLQNKQTKHDINSVSIKPGYAPGLLMLGVALCCI